MSGGNTVRDVIKDVSTKVSVNIFDDIYKDYIKPRLERIKNKPKNAYDIFEILEEYFNKSYDRYKYMNTIVFKKETKTIDDLYIPLTILKNGRKKREKIVVNENIYNIFQKSKKILLIDLAGMGKSTIIKYMYLKWLRSDYDIPFLIELRKIEKGESLLDYICKELCLSEKQLTSNDIKFLLERGDFIFFLDGYDEISKENKEEITKEMQKFILEFGKNSFMISSREDESLNSFSDFEKYHIEPLSKFEAYELIRMYDQNGSVADDLIKEIENNGQYEILKEFLVNPLMVSLLYLTYHYKGKIQYKKHLFYRQVYDALYEGHDITKGDGDIHKKKSGLDIDGFNNLLSAMGYLSVKMGKISYGKIELKQMIEQAVGLYWTECPINVNDMIHDILHAVPVFVEEGIEFKWTHKSFAEYFAANFICTVAKEKENQIVRSIMHTSNNINLYNVMDFCYDMDAQLANEVIVYEVVSNYVRYRDEYAEPLENDIDVLTCFYKFLYDIFFIKIEGKSKERLSANDLMEAIRKVEDIYDNSGMPFDIVILSSSQKIIEFFYNKPIYSIIKLLYDKEIDIFYEVKCKEFSMKFWNDLKNGIYWWENNVDPIFQNDDNGKSIVSYIHHRNNSFNGEILDYDKCKRLKKRIENNKLKINEDIFSF